MIFFSKSFEMKPFSVKKIDSIDKKSIENLSGGLKFKTVSNSDYDSIDFKEFEKFISYLKKTYPLIFKKTEFKRINDYALVFKLNGLDKSKKPILLIAHYDVVPVRECDEKEWQYPPFSGYFDEEYIYSRGTLDDKASFFAIFEAVNNLLKQNFLPQSDIYLAFSPVEEVGSKKGAAAVADYFLRNNIDFDMVLDEGGRVLKQDDSYAALIGISEKGRVKAKITIKSKGGHASMPDKTSSVEKIAKLILAFQNNKTSPVLTDEVFEYYKKMFNSFDFYTRFLIANKFILKPLLIERLSELSNENHASLYSTVAITMLEASNAPNVISEDASMVIDSRVLPSQNCDYIKKHIDKVIKKTFKNGELKNIEIDYFDLTEPSKVSHINSDAYLKLGKNINDLYENVIITPFLTLGGTDAREYAIVSDNIYRFMPAVLTKEEVSLMHANNEKISIENYNRMIYFYENLIKNYY